MPEERPVEGVSPLLAVFMAVFVFIRSVIPLDTFDKKLVYPDNPA
jgi:hypothetical protein